MKGLYTPPQRNFDGSAQRRAMQAQFDATLNAHPDAHIWAERATANAKRSLTLLGNELFDAVMAYFSDGWFEAHTWRDQAEAYGRLRDTYTAQPSAGLHRLVAAFGEPDIIDPEFN